MKDSMSVSLSMLLQSIRHVEYILDHLNVTKSLYNNVIDKLDFLHKLSGDYVQESARFTEPKWYSLSRQVK